VVVLGEEMAHREEVNDGRKERGGSAREGERLGFPGVGA
jgi:hypothetical protein